MIKVLPIFLILISCSLMISGQTINYSYDNTGNLVKKKAVILPMKSTISEADDMKKESYIDSVDTYEIKLFPNPTKGLVHVNISDTGNDPFIYAVYSFKGSLILKEISSERTFDIDLSGHPAGSYIFHVLIGTKTSEWIIIKQ